MKSRVISLLLLVLVFVFTAAGSYADEPADIAVNMTVAPNTLNIQSQGTIVTVHTDIAYSAVTGSTVTLNDIAIEFYKEDNRGNFVAKFSMDAVKDLVDESDLELGTITLRLAGMTTSGDSFSGEQEINVISNVAAGNR